MSESAVSTRASVSKKRKIAQVAYVNPAPLPKKFKRLSGGSPQAVSIMPLRTVDSIWSALVDGVEYTADLTDDTDEGVFRTRNKILKHDFSALHPMLSPGEKFHSILINKHYPEIVFRRRSDHKGEYDAEGDHAIELMLRPVSIRYELAKVNGPVIYKSSDKHQDATVTTTTSVASKKRVVKEKKKPKKEERGEDTDDESIDADLLSYVK